MSIAQAEPATRLGPESNGMLMTPEEFDAVRDAERGYRYELVRGVVIVTPPPDEAQRGPNEELGYLLLRYKEDNPKAQRSTTPCPRTTSGSRTTGASPTA